MNGILIINKPKNYTSRDIVNIVSKKFKTKKVGHTGTLDPMAEGVLVICIGSALKICEMLTEHDKSYVAGVNLGVSTDTIDTYSNSTILKNIPCNKTKDEIEKALDNFNKTYMQEVPAYSAVKVNGKKLYEYARQNKEVELPKKEVTVKNIKLLGNISHDNDQTQFKFSCDVSKGTYIRALIRDIGEYLDVPAVMTSLLRTRQGTFTLDESYTLEDIENGNYKLLSIEEALPNIPVKMIPDKNLKKVKNGAPIDKFVDTDIALLKDNDNNIIAIYKNDDLYARTYKMLN